jgi:hypothetical protein
LGAHAALGALGMPTQTGMKRERRRERGEERGERGERRGERRERRGEKRVREKREIIKKFTKI